MDKICRLNHYKDQTDEENDQIDDEEAEEVFSEGDILPRLHKMHLACKQEDHKKAMRNVPFPIIAGFHLGGITDDDLKKLMFNYTGQLL